MLPNGSMAPWESRGNLERESLLLARQASSASHLWIRHRKASKHLASSQRNEERHRGSSLELPEWLMHSVLTHRLRRDNACEKKIQRQAWEGLAPCSPVTTAEPAQGLFLLDWNSLTFYKKPLALGVAFWHGLRGTGAPVWG